MNIVTAQEKIRALRWDTLGQTVVRRIGYSVHPLFWGYLGLITMAELVTSVISPVVGLVVHALVMLLLLAHAALGRTLAERRLALALTLAPLIRILSLGLPLGHFPQLTWYPIVAVPLLLATWLAIRQIGLSRQALSLRAGNLPLQLLFVGAGLGLGAIEYSILRPPELLSNFAAWDLILAAINLTVFTGFTEELIFRGVLQSTALAVMERWALVYVALLFGALHIGYLSVADVIFVTAVGLFFAFIVRCGASLLGVALAHGLTNITLFLLMPYMLREPGSALARVLPWLIAAGTIGALVASWLLWRRAPETALLPRAILAAAGDPDGVGILDEVAFPQRGPARAGLPAWSTATVGEPRPVGGAILTYATRQGSLVLLGRRYLLTGGNQDPSRRVGGRVPGSVTFRTKARQSLAMLQQVWQEDVPMRWVVGSEALGAIGVLRDAIATQGRLYIVAVPALTPVWTARPAGGADATGLGPRPAGSSGPPVVPVANIVAKWTADHWQRLVIAGGPESRQTGDWARTRVTESREGRAGREVWLLACRSITEPGRIEYYLSNAPEDTALQRLAEVASKRDTARQAFMEGQGARWRDPYAMRHGASWTAHMTAAPAA